MMARGRVGVQPGLHGSQAGCRAARFRSVPPEPVDGRHALPSDRDLMAPGEAERGTIDTMDHAREHGVKIQHRRERTY